ncbi:MAG: hypothetical protein ACE5GY_02310 [Thermodesulfobacteriota bacterium]
MSRKVSRPLAGRLERRRFMGKRIREIEMGVLTLVRIAAGLVLFGGLWAVGRFFR